MADVVPVAPSRPVDDGCPTWASVHDTVARCGGEVEISRRPDGGWSLMARVPGAPPACTAPVRVVLVSSRPLVTFGVAAQLDRMTGIDYVLVDASRPDQLGAIAPDDVVLVDAGSVLTQRPVLVARLADGIHPVVVGRSRGDVVASAVSATAVATVDWDAGADALRDVIERVAAAPRAIVTRLPLTDRELQVHRLVRSGLGDKQIAAQLGISVKTSEKHVGSLLRKGGVPNRTLLAQLTVDELGRLRPVAG